MVDKKMLVTILAISTLSSLGTALVTTAYFSAITINMYSNLGVDLESTSIHCRITMWKGDEKVFDQYHAGAVTNLGDNMTLFKWFGDTDMQYGSLGHNLNATWISIGNDTGTLGVGSTQLPNEWNRTTGTIDTEIQSALNISCTFYPTGTQVADCIGINCASSGDGNLVFYDTFSEVTGIDETFTINVDFKVSVAHS